MANTPVLYSGKWSKITRIRTVKPELPVSYRTIRTRVFKTIASPKSYRFTRTRTPKFTAGTFSYLHSSYHVTATDTLPSFNDSVSHVFAFPRTILENVLQPTSSGILIGNESGNILGDESGNEFGTEKLFFNDVLSYEVIENGSDGIFYRNLYDTTFVEDTVQAESPNPNRYFTDTLTTSASVSYNVIKTRNITESVQFALQTESGNAIQTENGMNILVSGQSVYDSVSYGYVRAANLTETLTTTDSISSTFIFNHNQYNANATDTFTTSDSVVAKVIQVRYLNDNLPTTAVVTTPGRFYIYDTLTTSDSVSIHQSVYRKIAETLITSDHLTAVRNYTRSLSETFTTSDSVSYIIRQSFDAALTDTLTTSDSAAYQWIRLRNVSDNLTTSDSIQTQQFVSRKLIDTLSLATFVKAGTTIYANLTDTMPTFSDSIATNKHQIVSFTENIPTIDHLSRQITYGRRINETDTGHFTDQFSRSLINYRQLYDTMPDISDTVIVRASLVANPIDTFTFTDSVSATVIRAHFLTDTLTTSDSVKRGQFLTRNLSENFTTIASPIPTYRVVFANLVETFTTSVGIDTTNSSYDRFMVENLTTTAYLSSHKVTKASLQDSFTTSANVARINRTLRFPQDTFYFSDNATRNAIQFRTASDNIYKSYLPAELSRYIIAPRNPSVMLTTVDSVSRRMASFRNLYESMRTTDSLDRNYISVINLHETLHTIDTLIHQAQMARSITEHMPIFDDSTSRLVIAPRNLTEALMRYDQTARLYTSIRRVEDTLRTTDSLLRNINFNRLLTDNLLTSDSLQNINRRVRQLIETFPFQDMLERAAFYTRNPIDTSVFQDLINRNTVQYRETSELFGVTDFVLWRNTYQIAVELNEILLTSDSPDYHFAQIPTLVSLLKLGDSVIFKTESGVLGRGRIVAVNVDSYTIDPYINHQSLYDNKMLPKESIFPIINKQDVALLPANYR